MEGVEGYVKRDDLTALREKIEWELREQHE